MTDPRAYPQGQAFLGYPSGPRVVFRINPDAVDWQFQINTAVTETLGGRVVQVLGATLSDITVRGHLGEVRGAQHVTGDVLADTFMTGVRAIIEQQSRDSTVQQKSVAPPQFSFPSKGWLFDVYVKDVTPVEHQQGKFSYQYAITLMFNGDRSDSARILGSSNGLLAKGDAAVKAYIDRIADGIGWHYSDDFNGVGGGLSTTPLGTPAQVAASQAKHDPTQRKGAAL